MLLTYLSICMSNNFALSCACRVCLQFIHDIGLLLPCLVLVHGKTLPFKPINPDDYERVLQENERVLKENEKLKQTEILFDENSVNCSLIMVIIISLFLANNMSEACIFILVPFSTAGNVC